MGLKHRPGKAKSHNWLSEWHRSERQFNCCNEKKRQNISRDELRIWGKRAPGTQVQKGQTTASFTPHGSHIRNQGSQLSISFPRWRQIFWSLLNETGELLESTATRRGNIENKTSQLGTSAVWLIFLPRPNWHDDFQIEAYEVVKFDSPESWRLTANNAESEATFRVQGILCVFDLPPVQRWVEDWLTNKATDKPTP
jgi:hypothetical protein